VLPHPVIRELYEFHPWAPIIAIDALIAVPFYLVGMVLVGKGHIRRRSRNRGISAVMHVRRGVRSLYR
jgi:signal peptidase